MKHTCNPTSYSGLALTFLAGGLAGAAAALLLAPRSGKATREIMGRRLDATAQSARGLRGRLGEKLTGRLNDTADSALAMKGRLVNKLNHAADSARELKDRAFRKGQDIREEAASVVGGDETRT